MDNAFALWPRTVRTSRTKAFAGAAALLAGAAMLTACGSSGSGSAARTGDLATASPSGSSAGSGSGSGSGVGAKICAAVGAATLQSVFGSAPGAGTPAEPRSGVHGCQWHTTERSLGVLVFDVASDLPSGDGAADTLAPLLDITSTGFSISSISSSTSGGRASVVVSFSNTGPPSADDTKAINAAAQAAAG